MAKFLNHLIGLKNVKKSKSEKKEVTTLGQPELTKLIFIWMEEHQWAFDALKIALTTTSVLRYPNITKGFV